MATHQHGHTKLPPIDPATGLRLRHGNGCKKVGNDCFICPIKPDCNLNSDYTASGNNGGRGKNNGQFKSKIN